MNRILIDWGTSNARAFLVSDDGELKESRELRTGVLNVPTGGFPAAFEEMTAGWRSTGEHTPVIMSGMVGSRKGWVEAPYASCPANADALAERIIAVLGYEDIRIVPGVCLSAQTGRRDVIRGEEVQIVGALKQAQTRTAILCLPGTHSKWVHAEDGCISDFATSMTGEVFDLMRRASILAQFMPNDQSPDPSAFARGVARTATPGGLLHHLFSVRADALFDDIGSDALPSYLSGLMIGHEIRQMHAMYMGRLDAPTLLVASDGLAASYQMAFDHVGVSVRRIDAVEATITGLLTVLDAANELRVKSFSAL